MRVLMIARPDCEGGNCPTTYLSDRNSLLVLGDIAQTAGRVARVSVPEGLLVEHLAAGGPSWPAGAFTGAGTGTLTVEGDLVTDPDALAAIAPAAHEQVVELALGEAA